MNLPKDIDPECVGICDAMNKYPGIQTTSSCCGHGSRSMWIFFSANSLDSLPPVLYWMEKCHNGITGWQVSVYTDCSMGSPVFLAESLSIGQEAYDEANKIADYLLLGLENNKNDVIMK